MRYVASLNRMVDAVRAELKPDYRQDEGGFLIFDDFGVRGMGKSAVYLPSRRPVMMKSRKKRSPRGPSEPRSYQTP